MLLLPVLCGYLLLCIFSERGWPHSLCCTFALCLACSSCAVALLTWRSSLNPIASLIGHRGLLSAMYVAYVDLYALCTIFHILRVSVFVKNYFVFDKLALKMLHIFVYCQLSFVLMRH